MNSLYLNIEPEKYSSNKLRTMRYRFGFNGQEKSDEIKCTGNHNTALFWEYDTRLRRRWNLDPKPNVSISSYATFANIPIWFSDPYGDTVRKDGFSNRKILRDLNKGIGVSKKNSPYYFDKKEGLKIDQKKYDALPEDKQQIVDNIKGAIEDDIVFTIKKSRGIDQIPGSINPLTGETATVYGAGGAATFPNIGPDGKPDFSGKSGVTVYWTGVNTPGDAGFMAYKSPTLYHELGGHGFYRYTSQLSKSESSSLAVSYEELIRACMGLPRRGYDDFHKFIPMIKMPIINQIR